MSETNKQGDDELIYIFSILQNEIDTIQDKLKNSDMQEDKTDLIGKINLLKNSKELIRKCYEHGVIPRAIWRKVPMPQHEWSEYRIMEDGDSDNQKYWTELEHIRLSGGEIIIG